MSEKEERKNLYGNVLNDTCIKEIKTGKCEWQIEEKGKTEKGRNWENEGEKARTSGNRINEWKKKEYKSVKVLRKKTEKERKM